MNSMSYRFALPGGLVGLYEVGNDGINWWSDYNDTVRGQGVHGLLDRSSVGEASHQTGGLALPCMASHTLDGVSGMSACRTP